MEIATQKKTVGRYGNMVRLNVWIMTAQDRQLDKYCQVTGDTKSKVVKELLQIGINMLRQDEVI